MPQFGFATRYPLRKRRQIPFVSELKSQGGRPWREVLTDDW
ncbi:hypothetical protein ACPOL_3708 [Acidisarcina polymorpha]|uniref:Uncharacterized protein n=1 Tax=Acidisarcina polymorpha TaxID=2211140 RepID=A0A2Z5G1N2_9BACT|nr:hypothetical protein ACPOL_3708 [Acidisarcina polymorpha]